MTHDELLARLDLTNKHLIPYDEFEKRNSALRAVVELHKPMADWRKHPIEHDVCDCCGWQKVYPCPTIQALERKLS